MTKHFRLTGLLGAAGLLGLGYFLGSARAPLASAQDGVKPASATVPASTTPGVADKRIVAYINEKPVSREEFGDYLIARYGEKTIDLFVNKKIIELAAAKRNIEVTEIEISATINEDAKIMKISPEDFEVRFLRSQGKTLWEWREDVIRPRLMMAKMFRADIKVTDDDIRKRFINKYGEKVKAKIIVWPRENQQGGVPGHLAIRKWDAVRKDPTEFDREAATQPDPMLASKGGLIEPLGRYAAQDDEVEKAAFALKEGEVSGLIETKAGRIIIKSLGKVEPVKDVEKDFEANKEELRKEVIDFSLARDIKRYFEVLHNEAKPQTFITKPETFSQIEKEGPRKPSGSRAGREIGLKRLTAETQRRQF